MQLEKSVAISFRVTPHFKRLLEAAAKRENRSQTNLLETLLFAYCREHGVEDELSAAQAAEKHGAKKK